MMKTQAIIASAGLGERLNQSLPKPLVLLKGKPILAYTCAVFQDCSSINSIILVVHEEYLNEYKDLVSKYGLKKVSCVIAGGEKRQASVANGCRALDEDTECVVIHDGARPLVTPRLIESSIDECKKKQAVIVAVPVKPTVKRVDLESMVVTATLNRDEIWEVQTPQVFSKEIICQAHSQENIKDATDDAFLVEQMGHDVAIVKGDYRNIKITTEEDMFLAEKLMED